MISLSDSTSEGIIIGASVIGILFGLINAIQILTMKVSNNVVMAYKDDRQQEKF